MTRKKSRAVEPAIFAGTPRGWACAHPSCTFRVHTHVEVCERFCCKHCETNFFSECGPAGQHHGRLCERMEVVGLPRAEPAVTSRLLPGTIMPTPLERGPADGVEQRATCSGATYSAPSSEVPAWVSHWKKAGEDGELPFYIQRRRSDDGWDWHFCLLCRAWVDLWHLTSKRHLQRAQCPEWYIEVGETESTMTPHDAADSTSNDICSPQDINSTIVELDELDVEEAEHAESIGDISEPEQVQQYLEDLWIFFGIDEKTEPEIENLRPVEQPYSWSATESWTGAKSWSERDASHWTTGAAVDRWSGSHSSDWHESQNLWKSASSDSWNASTWHSKAHKNEDDPWSHPDKDPWSREQVAGDPWNPWAKSKEDPWMMGLDPWAKGQPNGYKLQGS